MESGIEAKTIPILEDKEQWCEYLDAIKSIIEDREINYIYDKITPTEDLDIGNCTMLTLWDILKSHSIDIYSKESLYAICAKLGLDPNVIEFVHYKSDIVEQRSIREIYKCTDKSLLISITADPSCEESTEEPASIDVIDIPDIGQFTVRGVRGNVVTTEESLKDLSDNTKYSGTLYRYREYAPDAIIRRINFLKNSEDEDINERVRTLERWFRESEDVTAIEENVHYKISVPSNLVIEKQSATLKVGGSGKWKIVEKPDWVSLSANEGVAPNSILVTALSPAEDMKSRTGVIEFETEYGQIANTKLSEQIVFEVTSSFNNITVPYNSISIPIQVNTLYHSWTVSTDIDATSWIKLNGQQFEISQDEQVVPLEFKGTQELSLTFSENRNKDDIADRVCRLTFKATIDGTNYEYKYIKVSQQRYTHFDGLGGVDINPNLEVVDNNINISCDNYTAWKIIQANLIVDGSQYSDKISLIGNFTREGAGITHGLAPEWIMINSPGAKPVNVWSRDEVIVNKIYKNLGKPTFTSCTIKTGEGYPIHSLGGIGPANLHAYLTDKLGRYDVSLPKGRHVLNLWIQYGTVSTDNLVWDYDMYTTSGPVFDEYQDTGVALDPRSFKLIIKPSFIGIRTFYTRATTVEYGSDGTTRTLSVTRKYLGFYLGNKLPSSSEYENCILVNDDNVHTCSLTPIAETSVYRYDFRLIRGTGPDGSIQVVIDKVNKTTMIRESQIVNIYPKAISDTIVPYPRDTGIHVYINVL